MTFKVIRVDHHNPPLEYDEPFDKEQLVTLMTRYLEDEEIDVAMTEFNLLKIGQVGLFDNGMDGFEVRRVS